MKQSPRYRPPKDKVNDCILHGDFPPTRWFIRLLREQELDEMHDVLEFLARRRRSEQIFRCCEFGVLFLGAWKGSDKPFIMNIVAAWILGEGVMFLPGSERGMMKMKACNVQGTNFERDGGKSMRKILDRWMRLEGY